MMFADRSDAGKKLAEALPELDPDNTVVIALPRGGVPVAAEICAVHDLPLDLVLVRKIGAPGHSELAMGAVVDGPEPMIEINADVIRHLGLADADLRQRAKALMPEIDRRRQAYLGDRPAKNLTGKTVLVVDDGVATGATLRASLRALRARKPARIIVALPIAPSDTLRELRALAEDVICLTSPVPFYAVGQGYRDFSQTSDAEVIEIMKRFA